MYRILRLVRVAQITNPVVYRPAVVGPIAFSRGHRMNSSQSNQNSSTPGASSTTDWTAPVWSYEDIKAHVRSPKPGSILIDVREKDEVAQGTIPTSHNVPLSDFTASIRASPEEFRKKHGFEKPQEDQEVIFYCRSGRRSASASDTALKNGYKNVRNYSGSWLDWVKRTQENDYNT